MVSFRKGLQYNHFTLEWVGLVYLGGLLLLSVTEHFGHLCRAHCALPQPLTCIVHSSPNRVLVWFPHLHTHAFYSKHTPAE